MAIFGRGTARQRLRNAARESLAIPAFSAPVDCSTWVLGGLWPAELAIITPETASLAEYLDADLQRIVDSANGRLHAIGQSDLAGRARDAAEASVIDGARAFALLRVESTVRQLHEEALEFRTEHFSLNSAPAPAPVPAPAPAETAEQVRVEPAADQRTEQHPKPGRHERPQPVRQRSAGAVSEEPRDRLEDPVVPALVSPPAPPQPPPPPPPPPPPTPGTPEVPEVPEVLELSRFSAQFQPDLVLVEPVEVRPADDPQPVVTRPARAAAESVEQRLRRLLGYVTRQQPGLCWAAGTYADGKTVLSTDLAHGWIPSGIELPDDVQLLAPGRRYGSAAALLGTPTASATYTPGDRVGRVSDVGSTEPSRRPRELPAVDDLGWLLAEATHWRDGLPRMTNTLAKAGAAGTGVIDAELDLLRVHLDTIRYRLLAQYPDVDLALLLNCMLLAATEGIATGDGVSANYHFAWFRVLNAPPTTNWDNDA